MTPDLIKRFSSTAYEATLMLDNISVRVATNNSLVLDRLHSRECLRKELPDSPVAHWRVVVEEDVDLPMGNSRVCGLAHDGLIFVRIAHGGFLAADRQARFGISFVAAEFVENDRLFSQYYFPALLLVLREMGDSR
jgi:hypothetical protein